MAFKAQLLNSTTETSIVLVGTMDEHMEIPRIPGATVVKVDMQQVSYINSIGVRKWSRWVHDMKAHPQLILDCCPAIFVKNISTIKGMVGPNVSVNSFYVPYYNEESGERVNLLYRLGIEYTAEGFVSHPKTLPDPKFEIDVVEDIYFSFLKK